MSWPENELEPVETYLFQGENVRIGKYDCHRNHECFAATESISDNMFVLAMRPVWIRRQSRNFRYVGPGNILLHRAGCTIERKRSTANRDLAYWFAVRDTLFEEALSAHGHTKHAPRRAVLAPPALQQMFACTFQDLRCGGVFALEVESGVLSLLDEVCRSIGDNRAATTDYVVRPTARAKAKRLIDNAKAYIDENLCEDLDLDIIAREIGLSPFYLCRLFKSTCGITIHEYKIRQRLARVVNELVRGNGSDLTRIALDTGFSSHSHLTRSFARRYGITPSGFRRRQRRSPSPSLGSSMLT